jgi:sugar phosphate isomerase/epimerase
MRYAICNETFEGWEFARICDFIASLGYAGVEIAPYTLAANIADVSLEARRILAEQARRAGIAIVGLHWLLARTEGLQLTSPEKAVRERTALYLVSLAELCRDLGGRIMVFGSPAQRKIPKGATRDQARDYALDTFARALPGIAGAGVTLCLEPLAPSEADFINSCTEAIEILDSFRHPNFMLHLDVKAMASEAVPATELIRRHEGRFGHFHANDANQRGPGFGETDFIPILEALKGAGYDGWISVEVFDYLPDPETIARESLRYLKQCEHALDAVARGAKPNSSPAN